MILLSVLHTQVIASKIRIIMNYEFERLLKEGGCQNFKVLILNFPEGNGENSTLFGIAGLWPRIDFWASIITMRRSQITYIYLRKHRKLLIKKKLNPLKRTGYYMSCQVKT